MVHQFFTVFLYNRLNRSGPQGGVTSPQNRELWSPRWGIGPRDRVPCILLAYYRIQYFVYLLDLLIITFIVMSPALLCKSNVQPGNSEQCALAITHLLSSSCTSYFVPFHHYICAYCKCISLVV